jgi:hypothetical protein
VKSHSKSHLVLVGAVALGTLVVMTASPASADPRESDGHSADRGYNAIPNKVPGNVPSVGFEATSTRDFGDEVELGGRARTLDAMSVVMSSWGCEDGGWTTKDCLTSRGATFDVPLTFTIYADNAGIPGDVLATRTKTVAVQYRPSASPRCTDANDLPTGQWYSNKDHTCYNGFAQTIEMNLPDVTLPDKVIWTVKYNTTHNGELPVGETAACFTASGGCGYDALNVGVESFPHAPFAGTDVDENQVFRNGVIETGPANDPWTGFRPLGAITTQSRGDHQDQGDHEAY